MLIIKRAHTLNKLEGAASHSSRDGVARAGRVVLVVLLDPRLAVIVGMSGQLAFVATLLALSKRWLDLRIGMTATTLSLGIYGCCLALGHVAERRQRRGR